MRLLLTTDTVGGVWTFNLQLARELLKLGCVVTLVSFGRLPSSSQQRQVDDLIATSPTRCAFHSNDTSLEWMPDNRTTYARGKALMLQLCERYDPAVLLSSQFCWGALPMSIPKVVVAHSDVLSWAEAVGKAPLAKDEWLAAYRAQVQAGLDGADHVTAPTKAMLSDLSRNFRVGAPASVIANGVALSQVPYETRTLQAVTAGRMWDEAKGLNLLRYVVSSVPIAVAGEQRSDQSPLPAASQVSLLGFLPHCDVLRLFSQSAAYLCTSLYEPFGLAALEAALCGCAVLTNDIPSLREVWGDAALYYRDAAELSHLLASLAGDAAMLAEAQDHARRQAAPYTAARMARQYLELVRGLTAMQAGDAHALKGGPACAA